ncbi:unnamed protein product [Oikopleura dioica]|uniref:Uncharacterized protein n=1 Tax=Oikopleura dioica TaxID=34765 RepID=E4YLT9_OIKDI|nr:unnamed protein product [Oikopleura dioica]
MDFMSPTSPGDVDCSNYKPSSKQYDDSLNAADYGVIGGYFAIVILTGLGVTIYSNRQRKKAGADQEASDFFLASRSMYFIPVAASLFSSNIGSGHFVGLAGTAAANGLAVGAFEWNAMVILLVLGWLFLPVYTAGGISTMPEYLRERFGGQRIRSFLAVLSLLLYVFTKISADLFAGSIFIQVALGWDIYLSVIVLLAITAVYAVTGGLKAVIYVEGVQTIIMVVGGFVLLFLGLNEIEGGFSGLFELDYPCSAPQNETNLIVDNKEIEDKCLYPPAVWNNIIRPADDPDFPWPGVVFGMAVGSIWYWCSDQVIVQRTLSAKDLSHGKLGCVCAAVLKVLPVFLMMVPGMISRALWPDEIACTNAETCKAFCGTESGCTNVAYPTLVMRILPNGLKGLLLAVMLAALMSSLTATFNSGSTLFTMDIWKRFRKDAGNLELILIGRLFMIVLIGVSILWLPFIANSNSGQLFVYIQSVSNFLCPPIAVVFTMAIFWSRTNEPGAFWGMTLGLIVGCTRMMLEFTSAEPGCGDADSRSLVLVKVHYLHFALVLSAFVAIVTAVVSLLTPPIHPKYIRRLTFWSRFHPKPRVSMSAISRQRHEITELVYPKVFESAYSQDWTDSFNKRMHLLKRDGHGMHVLRRAPVFNSALANYPYQFEEAKRSGMHVL